MAPSLESVEALRRTRFALTGFLLFCVACDKQTVSTQAIDFGQPTEWYGVDDGPPEVTLGLITDLAVGRDGEIFAVDAQARTVHRILEGEIRGRIGREGEGPGEFTNPVAIWMSGPEQIMVADGDAARISVYDVSHDPAHHDATVVLPRPIEVGGDGCLMNDRIYITSFDGRYSIQKLSREGVHLASIGPVSADPKLPRDLQVRLLVTAGVGHLTCVPDEGLLIFVPLWQPDVQVLSHDGALRAEWPLTDYEQFTARRTADGSIRFGPDPVTGEAHKGLGTIWIGSGRFVLQLSKIGRDRAREEGPVEHRLFDLEHGELARLYEPLPRFTVWDGRRWYGYRNVPFPQVQVWRAESP